MDVWRAGGMPEINVAMMHIDCDILGPDKRALVWVQGCRKRCKGCMSPEWRRLKRAFLIPPEDLARRILDADVDGVTISGGEPMLQAAGLFRCLYLVRQAKRETSVICFTGYTVEELEQSPPGPGVHDLLGQCDLLIDGRYIPALNNARGMRGSTNQRFHFLTDRLIGEYTDIFEGARKSNVLLFGESAVLIGVPAPDVLDTFLKSIELFNNTSSLCIRTTINNG